MHTIVVSDPAPPFAGFSLPDPPDPISASHIEAPVQELANRTHWLREKVNALVNEKLRHNHSVELTRHAPAFAFNWVFVHSSLAWVQSGTSTPTLVFPVPFPQLPPTGDSDIIGRIEGAGCTFRAAGGHGALPGSQLGARLWRKVDQTLEVVGLGRGSFASVAAYEDVGGIYISVPLTAPLNETTRRHVYFMEILGEEGPGTLAGAELLSVSVSWRPLP
jgi:hypothetical protein